MDELDVLIAQNCAYIPGVEAAVVFTDNIFEKPAQPPMVLETSPQIKYRNATKTLGVVLNGDTNNLPVEIKEKVDKNPVACACLDFLINMTSGRGIRYGNFTDKDGVQTFTERKDIAEINDFFTDNNITEFFDEVITDLEWFNKAYIEIITDRNNPESRKIKYINCKDYVFSRLEEMNPNTGKSENHYYSALWGQGSNISKEDYETTPLLDSKRPLTDLQIRIGRLPDDDGKPNDEQKYRYVFSIDMPTPGHSYYPRAAWWSVIDSGWMDFANSIPEFKKALMTNQISLKYIIKINKKYFPEIFAKEGLKTKEEQIARVKKEYADLKQFLTGTANTGNSLIVYFQMTPDGKVEEPNIQIEVLDNKLKGGEYIDDSHEASAMIYTAFQVQPSLIGIIPGKTSNSISGSDKWVLMQIQQALSIRKRTKLLQVLNLVKEINNWPKDIFFEVQDLYISEDNPRQRIKEPQKNDNPDNPEKL